MAGKPLPPWKPGEFQVHFIYTGYPTDVTDTEVECSGLGYSGDVQQENGYVSVVTPNGESNRIACRYAI